MCLANANRLVRCLKKPLRLEARFRKRNFDAIVQMTGECAGPARAANGLPACVLGLCRVPAWQPARPTEKVLLSSAAVVLA